VTIADSEQLRDGIINVRDIDVNLQIKEGSPICIKFYQKRDKSRPLFSFSHNKEPRANVLSIKERPDGLPWDSFPEHIGIVDHINKAKGIVHFIVNRNIDSIVKVNQLKENVHIGSKLLVKLKKVKKDRGAYYVVLTCSTTQREPDEKLLKSFEGIIELSGSFGFANDIYIDSSLIAEHEIEDGSFIDGTAILNFNKKRGTWGWKAITLN